MIFNNKLCDFVQKISVNWKQIMKIFSTFKHLNSHHDPRAKFSYASVWFENLVYFDCNKNYLCHSIGKFVLQRNTFAKHLIKRVVCSYSNERKKNHFNDKITFVA